MCGAADSHANIYQHTAIGTATFRVNDWAVVDATQSYIRQTGTQRVCYYGGFASLTANGLKQACAVNEPFKPFYEWSTEVRLHNADGNPISWNLGFYHFNYFTGKYAGYYPGCGGNCSASSPGRYGPESIQTASTSTNAGYADVTVPVVERFRVLGGVRLSYDTLTRKGNATGQSKISGDFNSFDYRAGEEFDITPDIMQYFVVSQGYSPGGVYYDQANRGKTYPNEHLQSFELGIKSRFFDNMLQFNGNLYYYNIRNLPLGGTYFNFTLPSGQFCGQPAQNQPPTAECAIDPIVVDAETKGAEAQIKFSPTKKDLFGVSLSVLRAAFSDKQSKACNTQGLNQVVGITVNSANCYVIFNDFNRPGGPLSAYQVNGLQFPHAPKFSATFSYSHTFELAVGGELRLGAEAAHFSSSFVHPSFANGGADYAYSRQPAYWQEALNANYTSENDRWSLAFFIRNLSDYAVKQSYRPATLIADPRTIGMTLSIRP